MKKRAPMEQPDATMLGWLNNYARINHWRVPNYVSVADLIQDGLYYFYKVKEMYGPKIKTRSHFMSLVKRCFANHIVDLSNRRTRLGEILIGDLIPITMEQDDRPTESFDELLGAEDGLATFSVVLRQAPREVRAVVSLLGSDRGIKALRSPHRVFLDHRETTNEKLCRLCGYDPKKIDLAEQVRSYFKDNRETEQ